MVVDPSFQAMLGPWIRGTHESFVGRQDGRDVGEQERGNETPLHCAEGGRGEGSMVAFFFYSLFFILVRTMRVRQGNDPMSDDDSDRLSTSES